MTTFTKLLPPEAAPAKPILDRAHPLVLTSAQRMSWGDTFETDAGTVTADIAEKRPLLVNDVFVDDQGQFWVVRPAVEKVLHVTGDFRTMQEAAAALINRGVEVAEGVQLTLEGRRLRVEAEAGQQLSVYTAGGQQVGSVQLQGRTAAIELAQPGVYVVRCGEKATKIVVK